MAFRRFGDPADNPRDQAGDHPDSSFWLTPARSPHEIGRAELEEEVADVVDTLKAETSHLEPWLTEALEEVHSIMAERGAKYGPGNIAEFGELGVLVRLSDKLARLRHSSGKDFADEATRDAWLDIIGYGLIGLAWTDKNWPGSE